MVRVEFCHHHIRVPAISSHTQRGLRHPGGCATSFRLRELREAESAATHRVGDEMGEGSTWWESSTEPDPAFQFAFGRETSTASGPGRASSASASLLTFGQLSLIPPGKFPVLATSTSSDRVNEEGGGLLMPTTALAEATPLNSPGNPSEVTLADKSGLTTQETQSRLETVGESRPKL